MARKTRRKKSAKGRIRRGEQVTPERLMELSFAYAPPLIISAGVSNKIFDCLEDGAKTPKQLAERNRGISAGSADSNECACWSGSSKERSAGKVFAYSRKRRLSSKQKAGNARGVFWNHCAADNLTMASIVRYRSRRSAGRSREPGNRRHGILQSAGGKHHPDELSACAKARRPFES